MMLDNGLVVFNDLVYFLIEKHVGWMTSSKRLMSKVNTLMLPVVLKIIYTLCRGQAGVERGFNNQQFNFER